MSIQRGGAASVIRTGQTFYSTITAYGPPWDRMEGSGVTSTGIKLGGVGSSETKGGYNIAAVDPRAIPYGTTFTIDGMPGTWLAADTGGAFHIGTGKIDTFHTTGHADLNRIGATRHKVTILEVGSGPNDPAIERAKRDTTSAVPAGNIDQAKADALGSGILDVIPGGTAIKDVLDVPKAFLQLALALFKQDTWFRIGKTVGGSIITIVGLISLGYVALNTFSPKTASTLKDTAKTAASAAVVA